MRSVLFVDSDPSCESSASMLLAGEGYDVLTVSTATEALAKVASGEIDAVVADLDLPDMNGVVFLKRLRLRYPEVARVLATACADFDVAVSAVNEAQVHQMLKPWDDELQGLMRQLCERRRHRAPGGAAAHGTGAEPAVRVLLEMEYPGITRLQVADDGRIVLEELAEDSVEEALSALAVRQREQWAPAEAAEQAEDAPLAEALFDLVEETEDLSILGAIALASTTAAAVPRQVARAGDEPPDQLGRTAQAAEDDGRGWVDELVSEVAEEDEAVAESVVAAGPPTSAAASPAEGGEAAGAAPRVDHEVEGAAPPDTRKQFYQRKPAPKTGTVLALTIPVAALSAELADPKHGAQRLARLLQRQMRHRDQVIQAQVQGEHATFRIRVMATPEDAPLIERRLGAALARVLERPVVASWGSP